MKTVIVFGAGLIGSQLDSRLRDDGMDVRLVTERINSKEDAARQISKVKDPIAVFNAMGKTGRPNVDWCEQNKEETYDGNVRLPLDIAAASWEHSKVLPFIHVSSGCIFDGSGPFREGDTPNFTGSYYSYTKLEAEKRLFKLAESNKHSKLMLHRIRMPFMGYPDGRNLLTKLLRYKRVVNTLNSVTSMDDYIAFVSNTIAHWLLEENSGVGSMMTDPEFGWSDIIHAVNEGPITHKRILEIFQEENPDGDYLDKEFISPEQLNSIVGTPRTNCVLKRSNKFTSRPTEEAIRDAIQSYVKLS